MNVDICIQDGPLAAAPAMKADPIVPGGAGAVVRFDGVVRAGENGGVITALDYEVYEPMASRQLRRLAEEVGESFGLLAITAIHSRGRVMVGQCAFRLQVAAVHRAEALAAMEAFIDRMKRDVPIWKTAVHADSTAAEMTSDQRDPLRPE
jgi:molybdopterin synthase catalytic subunit